MKIVDILIQLIPLLSPLVMLGLGYVSKLLADLIKAKTKNEYLSGVLVRLNTSVVDAVKAIEQSVVEEIKKASADGVITDAERLSIKQAALDAVKSYLGVKGLNEIGKVLGLSNAAVEGLISDKIEAAVHDLKKTQSQTVTPVSQISIPS